MFDPLGRVVCRVGPLRIEPVPALWIWESGGPGLFYVVLLRETFATVFIFQGFSAERCTLTTLSLGGFNVVADGCLQ